VAYPFFFFFFSWQLFSLWRKLLAGPLLLTQPEQGVQILRRVGPNRLSKKAKFEVLLNKPANFAQANYQIVSTYASQIITKLKT
jgi:hypothetical protein